MEYVATMDGIIPIYGLHLSMPLVNREIFRFTS